MDLIFLALLAAALILGVVIGFLVGRGKSQSELISLTSENATLQANMTSMKDAVENQNKAHQKIMEDSRIVFENLANEILGQKTKTFTETNKQNLATILIPLDAEIKSFKTRMDQIHTEQTRDKASLIQTVENLRKQTDLVTAEASNLATALKNDTKMQGSWGELILETLLERAGFQKGSHYLVQTQLADEDGDRKIPDVIINLPDNRCVVVDSKVSLKAYERFSSAQTEEERSDAIKAHIASIKSHYTGLASKKYQSLPGLTNSVDFVLMFIPIEPAYILAMREQPELWDEAYKKNVVIVSPANLFAVIKLVDDLWKRDTQIKNTQKIVTQGKRLYDKFVLALESFDDVGKSLEKAKEKFDETVGRLGTGKGNALKLAQDLSRMGGGLSSKAIPARFEVEDDESVGSESLEGDLQDVLNSEDAAQD